MGPCIPLTSRHTVAACIRRLHFPDCLAEKIFFPPRICWLCLANGRQMKKKEEGPEIEKSRAEEDDLRESYPAAAHAS